MPLIIDNVASPSQPVTRTVGGFPYGVVFDWRAKYAACELTHNYPLTNARATERTYLSGGRIRTAAAGRCCIEDGKLSIESAATNLLPYSTELQTGSNTDRTSWSLNAAIAPDGTTTADALVENAEYGEHYFGQPVTGLSDDTTYTWSIFVQQKGNRPWVCLTIRIKTNAIVRTYFNLVEAGGVGTQGHTGAGIKRIGSTNWYRIWVSHDVASGAYTPQIYFGVAEKDNDLSYTGDGSSGAYLWGRQLETGPVPTAPIPTAATTVSRACDWNNITIAQPLAGIFSAEGTVILSDIVFGFSANDASVYTSIISVQSSLYSLLYLSSSAGKILTSYDGTSNANLAFDWIAWLAYCLAVRWSSITNLFQVGYKLSNESVWTWGSATAFDGAFPLGNTMYIGYGPSYPFNVKRVTFYNFWLNDPE